MIVTELFIRFRKLNISLAFATQSYFAVPRNIKLNCTHDFIMKIPNKRDPQQIAINVSSDIVFKMCYNKCTVTPYSFLVNNTALPLDTPLQFICGSLERI